MIISVSSSPLPFPSQSFVRQYLSQHHQPAYALPAPLPFLPSPPSITPSTYWRNKSWLIFICKTASQSTLSTKACFVSSSHDGISPPLPSPPLLSLSHSWYLLEEQIHTWFSFVRHHPSQHHQQACFASSSHDSISPPLPSPPLPSFPSPTPSTYWRNKSRLDFHL